MTHPNKIRKRLVRGDMILAPKLPRHSPSVSQSGMRKKGRPLSNFSGFLCFDELHQQRTRPQNSARIAVPLQRPLWDSKVTSSAPKCCRSPALQKDPWNASNIYQNVPIANAKGST